MATRFVKLDLRKLVDNYRVDRYQTGLSLPPNTKYIQCNCPFCPECGEPNSKPTLYVYPKTMSFYCFRCHTTGIDQSVDTHSESYTLDRIAESTSDNLKFLGKFKSININHLSKIRDKEYLNYFLECRTKEYLSYLDYWDLREITLEGKKGIFIPFYYNDIVVTYQVRYIDKNSTVRYYTKPGIKLPYFPTKFDSKLNYDSITLVEGVFDALAASIFKLPNPIAVLGSALPLHIITFITEVLKPSNIILAFDDMNINKKLRDQLSDYIANYSYIDTNSNDLDEYLRFGKKPIVVSEDSILEYQADAKTNDLIDTLLRDDNYG